MGTKDGGRGGEHFALVGRVVCSEGIKQLGLIVFGEKKCGQT